jgi:hypothetical protein
MPVSLFSELLRPLPQPWLWKKGYLLFNKESVMFVIKSRGARGLAFAVALLLAASVMFAVQPPEKAYAALDDGLPVGIELSTYEVTVPAVNASVKINYNFIDGHKRGDGSTGIADHMSIYVEKYNETFASWEEKWFLAAGAYDNSFAENVEIMSTDTATGFGIKTWPAGTYYLRLRDTHGVSGAAKDVVSKPIKVTIEKIQTTIDIGKTAVVVKKPIAYTSKKVWKAEKEVTVTWATKRWNSTKGYLQKLKGKTWENIGSALLQPNSDTYKATAKFTIEQTTAAETQYRIYVPEDDYVTGVTSDEFTVSGKLVSPKLNVEYSATSQQYGKTPVTLNITAKAATGTATVYDGDKKLKDVKVKSGKATYKLSKKLAKGTHNIKVVFKPTGKAANTYKSETSKVKKIKVK